MLAGNLFLSLSHLMRLYVWSQAFRRAAAAKVKEEPDGNGHKAFQHPAQTLCEGAVV
jgi:hypothetical protein